MVSQRLLLLVKDDTRPAELKWGALIYMVNIFDVTSRMISRIWLVSGAMQKCWKLQSNDWCPKQMWSTFLIQRDSSIRDLFDDITITCHPNSQHTDRSWPRGAFFSPIGYRLRTLISKFKSKLTFN
jgi:hypothetical protein